MGSASRGAVIDRPGAPRTSARKGRLDPRRDRRRAITLLLSTLVVPGSAQLAAGNRTFGRVALRIWLGFFAVGLLLGGVALVSRTAAISIVTHPWFLFVLQWALLGFAALWAALFIDAWRLGRPDLLPMTSRRWMLGMLVVLLLVPALVLWFGLNVAQARSAVGSLFGGGTAVDATNGRYNILLLGGDSGADRIGMRPDSIQLASIDAETGRTVLLGFSRETENIHFNPGSVMAKLLPQGWTCGDECLLNALYTWGSDHAKEFPAGTADPGLLATTEAVEALSGLDIQYYVLVDLKGFQSVIDAIGGLDVNVQRRTPIGGGLSPIKGYIEPGLQHLDGYHALWYARSRVDSSNYQRMARQRCVLSAMVHELDPATVLLNFGSILKASAGTFQTDIPQSALAELAQLAVKTRQAKITSVNFVPPLIKTYDYDPAFVRKTVQDAIAASEKAPATTAAPQATSGATATAKPSATPSPTTTGSVMETPSLDPNAKTDDLASVCAVG